MASVPAEESDGRKVYTHSERNKDPILDALKEVLPDSGLIVSVAEGSGQHVSHFAQHTSSAVEWQPTEYDESLFISIRAWSADNANIRAPVSLDASATPWSFADASVDGIYNINMIHISPWACTLGLLQEAGRILKPGGFLFMYGPYKVGGEFTTDSNREFDASLRGRNAEWGLRDLDEVKAIAAGHGLQYVKHVDMPANNFSVIYRKQ